MEIVATRSSLDELNGPGPVVVLAARDAASSIAQDLPADIPVLTFEAAADDPECGRLTRLSDPPDDDSTTTLRHAPSAHCVLAFATDEARRQIEPLLAWWTQHCPAGPPATVDLRSPNGNDGAGDGGVLARARLIEALLGMYVEETGNSARREVSARAALAELRQEYERTRIAMDGIRHLLHRLQLAPWGLAFSNALGSKVIRPSAHPGGQPSELQHPLPMAAEGLGGIEIHMATDPSGEPTLGRLVVSVTADENGQVLGQWHVPYRAIAGGWLRLTFPQACVEPLHHLLLRIVWETTTGTPPGVSSAELNRWPDAPTTLDGATLDVAPALRLWRGLPGTTMSPRPCFWSRIDGDSSESPADFEYNLTSVELSRVRQTTSGAPPEYFRLLGDQCGFHLHPLPATGPASTSAAVLPLSCVEGTTRVAATVRIAGDRRRAPVEFAMLLSTGRAEMDGWPEAPDSDERVLACTNWASVPPDGQSHVVVLDLADPLETTADLHFATRVPDGETNAWAWAEWTEVAIRVGPTMRRTATAPHTDDRQQVRSGAAE